jgi:hypothetical protein
VIQDPPSLVGVRNAQLVAPGTDSGHWPRVREAERLTLLKSPQEKPRLKTGALPKGGVCTSP